jgi:YHS domain-containing protein
MRIRDPVCGMVLEWEEAVEYVVVDERVFYFCCPACAVRFRESLAGKRKPEAPEACDGPPPHGLPADVPASLESVSAGAVPRVAGQSLDDFEAAVFRAWQRRLPRDYRARPECRTLERALILQSLLPSDPERRRRSEVLTAAEIARLRTPRLEQNRVHAELRAIPGAFEEALRDAALSQVQVRACMRKVRMLVQDLEFWLRRDGQTPAAPLSTLPR